MVVVEVFFFCWVGASVLGFRAFRLSVRSRHRDLWPRTQSLGLRFGVDGPLGKYKFMLHALYFPHQPCKD